MVDINLNVKPMSVNIAYCGRKFKSDAYKAFETLILLSLPKLKYPIPDMIRIEFHFGFSSRNADVDNPVKPILDILQKKYKFNDRDVWEITSRKSIVKKGKEFITIGIYPYLPFD
jgi:Holliday junction resolvase RusA-like endonuclease